MKAYYSNEILVMMTKEDLDHLIWLTCSAGSRYSEKNLKGLEKIAKQKYIELTKIREEMPF